MHIHILGVGGTFMSGIALLAKANGHVVSGSDNNMYPPMSTQLQAQGITTFEGYNASDINSKVDCVIVGNVIRRGNAALEYILNQRIPYTSGPDWLARHLLKNKTVIAIAGTHGKTTTSSLVAHILMEAGKDPGFLIGGIPENWGISARDSHSVFFVLEADEYDSAFFDKRPKFLHYHPHVLILNNLEFDHADIYQDLAAIQQQFHYLVRTVPGNGAIVYDQEDTNLPNVLATGCWTPTVTFGKKGAWSADLCQADGSVFAVCYQGERVGNVAWSLIGYHNVKNALAAIAASYQVGVAPDLACASLSSFKNVKRRLEKKGQVQDIAVYDDFAHHPTAIATTLAGLRAKIGEAQRIIAVLEFGSYTMRSGYHKYKIKDALRLADMVACKRPQPDWGLQDVLAEFKQPTLLQPDGDTLIANLVPKLQAGDHVVIMSNSGFEGIHHKLLIALANRK